MLRKLLRRSKATSSAKCCVEAMRHAPQLMRRAKTGSSAKCCDEWSRSANCSKRDLRRPRVDLNTIDVQEVCKQRYSDICWRRNGLNKYDFSSQIKQIGNGSFLKTNQNEKQNNYQETRCFRWHKLATNITWDAPKAPKFLVRKPYSTQILWDIAKVADTKKKKKKKKKTHSTSELLRKTSFQRKITQKCRILILGYS